MDGYSHPSADQGTASVPFIVCYRPLEHIRGDILTHFHRLTVQH